MSLLGGSGATALDIWSTGAFSFESPLKDLLDSKNYTLEQLLSEDELLQELRGLHPVLIEYFSSEKSVTKLLRYITLRPSPPPFSAFEEEEPKADETINTAVDESGGENGSSSLKGSITLTTAAQRLNRQLEKRKSGEKFDVPEKDPEFRHIRFPYMACEIICCEIDGIINTLVDGYVNEKEDEDEDKQGDDAVDTTEETTVGDPAKERLLDIFFGVLYDTPAGQLDDYRAGYFDKILSLLFRKRPQELSIYINSGGSKGQESLVEAMMKHLYSHSIMQICQRLLLPPRPTPKQEQEGEEGAESTDQVTVPKDSMSAFEEDDEAAVAGGQDILSGEEDEEGENGMGIKCDWSKSGIAIEMLLTRLINPETLLQEGCHIAPVSSVETEQSIEEQRLSLSLNASEVLITVIQNSMLSSETMLSLTSLETMKRITAAATVLNSNEPFIAHESMLTSAMNVVESLILQLGGYGAVGTMSILDQAESQAMESDMAAENGEEGKGDEEPPQKSGDQVAAEAAENGQLIADLTSLLEILPEMLDGFASLLRHPSTKEWRSQVQFSKAEPVALLGTSRLRIVRVLESLVLLGDPRIDSKLVQSDCLLICLDLFWEFQWCSMLHQSVANLLVHVFEGQNARIEIQEYFISKCNLIGRLMNSFVEITDPRVHGLVMGLDKVIDTEGRTSDEMKDDAVADVLPVSEDDIDAAIEKAEDEEKAKDDSNKEQTTPVVENVDVVSTEAVNQESRDASLVGLPAPSQSFRYGYMGHVIIICQALVQACAGNEWSGEQGEDVPQQDMEGGGMEGPPSVTEGMPGDATAKTGESGVEQEQEPLLIAELVSNHELSEQWQEFVISTLASEIAVQSTPLGGLNAQPTDPLQAHRPDVSSGRRPGLADDGDVGDGDGAMAPPPPRGMLQASEINDIDDRDLEVAAGIMASLNLGRPASDDGSTESDGAFSGSAGSGLSGNSGDSNRSYNSGETNNSGGGYLFDDPLGKAGSLGIELGKLTQYKAGDGKSGEAEQNNACSDDDEDDHSSSDEEPPRSTEEDDDDDVPVMDLFAGNFNHTQGSPGETQPDSASFDFANFDNAFEGGSSDGAFGEFASAPGPEPPLAPEQNNAEADEIFGSGSSSNLLDDLDDSDLTQNAPPEGVSTDLPPSADPGTVVLDGLDQSSSKAEPETMPPPEANPAENEESDTKNETNTELLQPEKNTEDSPQKEGVLVS